LYSELPGKSGRPKNSSAAIQPTDQMSIEEEYLKDNAMKVVAIKIQHKIMNWQE
jgi:hypothetical protein